jgi:hypothetical protein
MTQNSSTWDVSRCLGHDDVTIENARVQNVLDGIRGSYVGVVPRKNWKRVFVPTSTFSSHSSTSYESSKITLSRTDVAKL